MTLNRWAVEGRKGGTLNRWFREGSGGGATNMVGEEGREVDACLANRVGGVPYLGFQRPTQRSGPQPLPCDAATAA